MSDKYSWMPKDDPLIALGNVQRTKVLGPEHVERSLAAADKSPLKRRLQECVTGLAWGAIWGRPGLDLKSRSLVTFSVLLAQGRLEELALHLRGALRNGWTEEEICEAILQIACYSGWPAAIQGFRVAEEVFAAAKSEANP